eukprot:scaffold32483_cov63-Phaeocystis_antarctica.AAC.2
MKIFCRHAPGPPLATPDQVQRAASARLWGWHSVGVWPVAVAACRLCGLYASRLKRPHPSPTHPSSQSIARHVASLGRAQARCYGPPMPRHGARLQGAPWQRYEPDGRPSSAWLCPGRRPPRQSRGESRCCGSAPVAAARSNAALPPVSS